MAGYKEMAEYYRDETDRSRAKLERTADMLVKTREAYNNLPSGLRHVVRFLDAEFREPKVKELEPQLQGSARTFESLSAEYELLLRAQDLELRSLRNNSQGIDLISGRLNGQHITVGSFNPDVYTNFNELYMSNFNEHKIVGITDEGEIPDQDAKKVFAEYHGILTRRTRWENPYKARHTQLRLNEYALNQAVQDEHKRTLNPNKPPSI